MQSRLAAGEMSQRVLIAEPTSTQADDGQLVYSWTTVAGCSSVPAKVEGVSGGETLRGRQVSARTRLVVTIRYRSDIDATMRVTYESDTYGILKAVDPYGDRRELRIECVDAD